MSRPTERYPDPHEFDDKLYKNLTILPNNIHLDLDFIKKFIDSEVIQCFGIPLSFNLIEN